MLEDFFIDLALEGEPGEPAALAGRTPEQALGEGLAKARAALGGLDWSGVTQVMAR